MNKKVLFLVNHDLVIYNFRKELVYELIRQDYTVYISSPYGKKIDFLVEKGCIFIETKFNRHGVNIFEDLKLLRFYKKLIFRIKPLVVLTYTIKPNIFGGFAAKKNNTHYISNITGLGTAVEKPGVLQLITTFLYKRAFSKIDVVFYQNEENMAFFVKKKIAISKQALIPGSGVNVQEFSYLEYPDSQKIHFAFISRIMKEKGIDYYLSAAEYIRTKHPNTVFHVCGFCEENYTKILNDFDAKNIIKYHGMVDDIRLILRDTHCVIHPSYYPEGISNVLLESASCGRPVITTNRSGCKETVINNHTGVLVDLNIDNSIINAIENFLELDNNARKHMGVLAREYVVNRFDRNIIVVEYMKKINLISVQENEKK